MTNKGRALDVECKCGGVLNTVTNSAITKSVYRAEVGGALGFSDALNNPARVIAPAIGGVLLGQVGASSLGILGAVIMAWVVFTIWRRLVVQNPPLPGQGESETAAA